MGGKKMTGVKETGEELEQRLTEAFGSKLIAVKFTGEIFGSYSCDIYLDLSYNEFKLGSFRIKSTEGATLRLTTGMEDETTKTGKFVDVLDIICNKIKDKHYGEFLESSLVWYFKDKGED